MNGGLQWQTFSDRRDNLFKLKVMQVIVQGYHKTDHYISHHK